MPGGLRPPGDSGLSLDGVRAAPGAAGPVAAFPRQFRRVSVLGCYVRSAHRRERRILTICRFNRHVPVLWGFSVPQGAGPHCWQPLHCTHLVFDCTLARAAASAARSLAAVLSRLERLGTLSTSLRIQHTPILRIPSSYASGPDSICYVASHPSVGRRTIQRQTPSKLVAVNAICCQNSPGIPPPRA